jgi:biopolymer transport protein ExbB/TolQ
VLAAVDATGAGAVEDAAHTLLQAGILGALLVLVGAFAFYAVWKWNKANEARVKDQKEMARDALALTNDIQKALQAVNGTTNALQEAVRANTEAVKGNTAAVMTMERTLNETVRDAVRAGGYRRPTPASAPIVPPVAR